MNNIEIYTVKKGDTLYSIAQKYNVSVDEIKNLNNLTSNQLNIGQQLKIPNNSNIYVVKKGDTLYSIANKFDMSVDELKRINNLTSNTLSVGQILKLTYDDVNPDQFFEYTIKSGDTLYSIANKNGISVDELKQINDLNSNMLSVGQVILIPIKNINNMEYVVKSGDSLYSIAKKYNTSVNNIKELNGLNSNLLVIGQKLLIPSN